MSEAMENISWKESPEEFNLTLPHISLRYCLDREHFDLPIGGQTFVLFRVILDTMLTISIWIANTTLISVICRYRKRYRGTVKAYNSGTSMKFVQFLACADLLVGLTIPVYLVPHYVCSLNEMMRGNMYVCMCKFVLTTFSGVMSNMSLISIAIDRYLAVAYTMRYRLIMTSKVCHTMIGAQVMFAVVTSSVLFFYNDWKEGSFCDLEDVVPYDYLISLAAIVHTVILVMVIGVHFKLHQKATQSTSRRNILMEGRAEIPSLRHIKSAKIFILVAGAYMFCWTPYSFCLLVRVVQHETSRTLDFLFQITFPLSYAYSLINPFIYAWKNTEIKNAVKWSLRRGSANSFSSNS